MRKMLRSVVLVALLFGCAVPPSAPKSSGPLPFCLEWNTMGDMDGGEAVTLAQRKMFHLGHFLTKSDFVRITLNKHYKDQLFVDRVITCYEENTPVLVEEVDAICACSKEDKKDEVAQAFSDYLSDCIREVTVSNQSL